MGIHFKYVNYALLIILLISTIITTRVSFITVLALIDSDNRELGGLILHTILFLWGLANFALLYLVKIEVKNDKRFISRYSLIIFFSSLSFSVIGSIVFLIFFVRHYFFNNIPSESLEILIKNSEPFLSLQVLSLITLVALSLWQTIQTTSKYKGANLDFLQYKNN